MSLRAETNVQDHPDSADGARTLPPKGHRPGDVAEKLHAILLDAQELLAQKGRKTRFGKYQDRDGAREVLELIPETEPSEQGLDFVAYRLNKRYGVRVTFDPYFFSRYRSNAYQDGRTIALPARSIFEGKMPAAMEHETVHLYLDLLARRASTTMKGELPLLSSVSATMNTMPSSYHGYFRFDETIAHTIDLLTLNNAPLPDGASLSRQFEKEIRAIVPKTATSIDRETADEATYNKGHEEWPEKIRSFGEIMNTVAETAALQPKNAQFIYRAKRGAQLPSIGVTFKLKKVAWKDAQWTTDVKFSLRILEPTLVQEFARKKKPSRKLQEYLKRYLNHQGAIGRDIEARTASLEQARLANDRARYLKELRELEFALLKAYLPHALP